MKKIIYSVVDNGIDGSSKDNILYSSFNEDIINDLLNEDKSKAYRTIKENIINIEDCKKKALSKLNGIDRLVLNLPNWIETK